jgi:DNA sulfur modification protein DndD
MGEHAIEFSTDKEKNVSVILGSNTCGKTTIVGAFIWGLYGVNNLKEPKALLNSVLAQKLTFGSQEVSVEITLNHDNKDYIILRTQKFSKTATGDSVRGNTPELKVSYVVEGGETIPVNPAECQNVIEGILPQALSDYFFFDGERIKSINTKANVKDAVRGLMGLDVYSAGMDHLNPNSGSSVIGKFKKEIDTGKDQEATRRKYQIEEFKTNLDGYEKKTPQILDELQHWQTKKDEYDRIIRENEDVKAAQTKRAQLEREVADYEEEIKNSETRFINDINYNASKFFAIPLIKRGFEVLKSAKDEGEGIPNMNASSIEYILKRGKCICGCDLTKNQGAVECI